MSGFYKYPDISRTYGFNRSLMAEVFFRRFLVKGWLANCSETCATQQNTTCWLQLVQKEKHKRHASNSQRGPNKTSEPMGSRCVALASVANWSLSAWKRRVQAASSCRSGMERLGGPMSEGVRRARLSSLRWAPWPKDNGHDMPPYWSNVGAGCCWVWVYLRTIPKENRRPEVNSANTPRWSQMQVTWCDYNVVALVQLEVWEDHNILGK